MSQPANQDEIIVQITATATVKYAAEVKMTKEEFNRLNKQLDSFMRPTKELAVSTIISKLSRTQDWQDEDDEEIIEFEEVMPKLSEVTS